MSGNYVTVNNFDKKRLVAGSIRAVKTPIAHQTIPVRYSYPSGEVGPLLIQTPKLLSLGVGESNQNTKKQNTNYYMTLVCFDVEKKFIDLMDSITAFVRETVEKETNALRKGGRRNPIDLDTLTLLKYKDDDDGSPALFPKLLTDYRTGDVTTKFVNKRHESLDPQDYRGKRCRVGVCLKIEDVFINSTISTVRNKLTWVMVLKNLPPPEPVTPKDLDFVDYSDDSDDDE